MKASATALYRPYVVLLLALAMLCDRQREPYAPCRQQRRLENVVDRDLLRKERHAQRLVVMAHQ